MSRPAAAAAGVGVDETRVPTAKAVTSGSSGAIHAGKATRGAAAELRQQLRQAVANGDFDRAAELEKSLISLALERKRVAMPVPKFSAKATWPPHHTTDQGMRAAASMGPRGSLDSKLELPETLGLGGGGHGARAFAGSAIMGGDVR